MRRTFLLLSILLLSLSAFAQSGEWGSRGETRAFAISGTSVFAADGRGITTYDVSDPSHIVATDFDSNGNETNDIALVSGAPQHVVVATHRGLEWYRIEGHSLVGPIALTEDEIEFTHVAAGESMVAAINDQRVLVYQRNGNEASFLGEYAYKNRVLATAIVGDALYVSVDREGTYVYDVPSTDWLTKLLEAPSAFALVGNTLWASSRDTGLTGIDVRDPFAPHVISSVGSGELLLDGVAATSTRVFTFEKNDHLRVYDVTDPTKPAQTATFDEWVNVIAANDDHLFLSGVIIDSEKVASATGKPIRAFDTHTLALLGEATSLAGPLSGVWTDGSLAYVVDPPYLRVMDVSKSAEPREISSLLVPGIQDHIRVKNGIAVLYGRAAVNLIDVYDPLHPRVVGNWATQGHPPSTAAIAGTTFVESNPHSGFHIVDYSNPAHAVQIGGRKWHYHSMASGDDAVYLLLHGVFLTVQIANNKDSVDKTKYAIIADQVDVVPPNSSNPQTLVLRTPDSLRVYSLADRFTPMQIASFPLDTPGEMATGDGDAYVNLDGTLYRLNVASPAAPVATDMKVLSPMQISVAGQKVVVADRYSLRVFGPDTASPVPPEPVIPPKRRAVR